MELKASFQQFVKALSGIYSRREATIIADQVFDKVTGFTRLDRLTKTNQHLSISQQQELEEKLQELLAQVPLQYVTGEAWFYHLSFVVNEHVLIPRPETEELVEWILERTAANPRLKNATPEFPFTLLDIGTGSGCMAIALKKNLPAIQVIALDYSEKALQVARQNATFHQTEITFLQANILDPKIHELLPSVDLIVSNPPYISEKEKEEMQPQVTQHEPAMALFVPDENPMLFYKAILETGLQKLKSDGEIFVEIHEEREPEIRALLQQYGFKNIIIRKDLNERYRMAYGMKG